MKIKDLTKPYRLNLVVASLVACGVAYPQIEVFAQTYEQFLEPYNVPSPSSLAIVSKQYIPNGPWIYHLSTKPISHMSVPAEIDLISGHYPGGQRGADGLVVGWIGDNHLTIGWPIGQSIMPGPGRVGNLEIAYINYEPDLKVLGKGVSQVILRDVRYEMYDIETSSHDTDCMIRTTATDGIYFNTVSMDIVGHGVGTKRVEGLGNGGSLSIKFSLTNLLGEKSPPLTPTQAKFSDISPFSSQNFPSHGPIQNGVSLEYSWFNVDDTPAIFEILRHGQYKISFNLTFGEQRIVYLVPNPIDPVAAAAYQRCESRTNIFRRLYGKELSAP